MKVFSDVRGSHIKLNLPVSSSCMIKLEGTDGLLRTDCIFVSNFAVMLQERAAVISCFKDYNYIFAFGHNPSSSSYSVTFTAFLVGKDCKSVTGSGIVKKIKDYYNKNRVSKKRKLVKLSIGDLVVKGVLTSMQLVGQNPELNTITVTMGLIGIEGVSND